MSSTLVRYEGGLRCRAEASESGAIVLTDAPSDNGGSGDGFSPSELLSASLGSCILSMMGMVAQSLRVDLVGATAEVTKTMANLPRRITSIAVHVRVPQRVDAGSRAKLEAAGHACPVHAVLGVEAPITFEWGAPGHSVGSER